MFNKEFYRKKKEHKSTEEKLMKGIKIFLKKRRAKTNKWMRNIRIFPQMKKKVS